MDVHVPFAVTAALRLRGVDVLTAQGDSAGGFDDRMLLDHALVLRRVLVTQDTDLLIEAAQRQQSGIPFAGVIYAPQMEITIGQLVRELELIARASDIEDWANWVEFLPLK